MKRLLTVAFLCAPLLTGCGMLGDHRRCGIHFEVLLPASVEQRNDVLVGNTGAQITAHPMGSLAGPVLTGQAIHGPTVPLVPTPAPMPAGRPGVMYDPCGPLMPQSYRLTVDEWQNLQQRIAKPLPRPADGQEE